MTKAFALTLLAATLLAGCGVSPAALTGAAYAKRSAVQTKGANDRRVELRLPARLLEHVADYASKLEAEWGQEMVRDMYGRPTHPKYRVKLDQRGRDVRVVASVDNFKTTLGENGYNAWRKQDGRDILVPFVAPVGPVRYYLEVRATIESVSSGKVVKQLPVHYISNLGQNYEGRFEAERP